MIHKVKSEWKGNSSFSADIDGYQLMMEGVDPETGESTRAPSPKKLLLAALGGCTGLDIVSILRKMRVGFSGLEVEVSGDVTEEHPKFYRQVHVVYTVKGEHLPIDKIKKAVELSEKKYCGVEATFRNMVDITSEIRLMEEK